MKGGVSETQVSRTRSRLSQPAALASPGAELLPSCREQSPVSGDLARDVQPTKRKFDATSKADPLSPKRSRLTRTDAQRPGVAKERSEQVDKLVQTTLQQPQPKYPERTYTLSLESEVERLEQVSPASDSDHNESQVRRARLTRKNLALFDRMAKKKGTNKTLTSAPMNSTAESLTTKTTSTTSSGFAIQAYKNGILDPFSSKPPINIDDIRERVTASRRTASPTESDHKRYVNTVGSAVNEATLVVKMSGKMLKEYDDEGYHQAFNQAFTGFPKDVGFNNGLSAPQPDFVEGLRMQDYEPFPIDEHVNGAVLYKDNPNSLTLPHLAGEWKGRGKDMDEARLQSAYDGAALVYARKQALSYLGKADPPGHAEITTFTTDGTNLNLYAHYAAPLGDGSFKYHQYPITSANLLKSRQEHNEGRRGLRNEQDYARKQSYALRDQLEEHWKKRGGAIYPITEGDPLPNGTFEAAPYEDEAGHEIISQPCQPTPAASSKPRKASRSFSSSKSLPSNYTPGVGGQKRKASFSSQESSNGPSGHKSKYKSRYKSYWTRDAQSGRYFHKHSDGRISWLDEDDDGY